MYYYFAQDEKLLFISAAFAQKILALLYIRLLDSAVPSRKVPGKNPGGQKAFLFGVCKFSWGLQWLFTPAFSHSQTQAHSGLNSKLPVRCECVSG